jgi:RNA polymerase sigma-70 factor, ECF subfamily
MRCFPSIRCNSTGSAIATRWPVLKMIGGMPYLELVDQWEKTWQSRAHFVGVAAQVMRRLLVDYARSHRAGAHPTISLHEERVLAPERAEQILALEEALERLAAWDARQSRIVELRFFGGLSEAETAEALGLGVRTVTREWNMAKAWLYGALQASGRVG